jgi:exonuclease III
MPYTYNVLTLNINGIRADLRKEMLADFLHSHHIDIALLQEVVCPDVADIPHLTPG